MRRWRGLRPLVFVVASLHAAASPAAAPPTRDAFIDGSGRKGPQMVAVPALEVEVGATPADPHYVETELGHRVTLSAYAIGRHEVTTEELAAFLSDWGNQREGGAEWVDLETAQVEAAAGGFAPKPGTAKRPAAAVTWHGARAYCRWLSEKTGRAYQLPTAAQWETAARAGTRTAWWWGDEEDPARYRSAAAAERATADVGSYPPNPWGLHDTAGNVWEWTRDCFEPDFATFAPRRDPTRFDEECRTPELRGGSFRDGGRYTRAAFRAVTFATASQASIGFRVARNGEPSP